MYNTSEFSPRADVPTPVGEPAGDVVAADRSPTRTVEYVKGLRFLRGAACMPRRSVSRRCQQMAHRWHTICCTSPKMHLTCGGTSAPRRF